MLGTLCEEGVAHLMGDARALYEHHERDAGDTILCAFKAGNWTKVSVHILTYIAYYGKVRPAVSGTTL